MARISYVVRVPSGVYYFRRVIPPALRPFMPDPWRGKSAWKLSLKTSDYGEAKRRADGAIRARCNADFTAAERAARGGHGALAGRTAPGSHAMPPAEEIEREWLAALLADDEKERQSGDPRASLQTAAERAQWQNLVSVPKRGMARDYAAVRGDELEAQHREYAEALGRADPEIVKTEIADYLRKREILFDPDSDAFYEAGLAALRGHVEAFGLMLERQRGKVVPTPAATRTDRGPKLSEAFADWKTGSGTRGSRKPADNTVREAEYAVRRLTEWCGDIRLADLTREQARGFRDALAQVATRLPTDLKRLPLKDLLKRDLTAYPPQHASTINKSLTLLAAIVVHAEAVGRFDAVPTFRNPFGPGIKLAVDARTGEARQLFEAADLKALFATGVFTRGERPAGGGGEAAFWLPLMALLSGARQGELAQLRIGDLAEDPETGIWFVNIDTTGGRKVKTAASRRKVPVHPELERIGLLRYRQSLLDGGADLTAPLWPRVEADTAGRQNGPWSKWFNRYLRDKAGIADRSKVFHSFRHTFKRMARDSGVAKDVHDAITGHSGGEDAGQAYGRGFGLKVLAEAMARIEVPEAVRGLS